MVVAFQIYANIQVKPGVVNWSRVHKSYDRWQKHMKCMENCSYAVELAQDKLKYR